jgi:polyisoprenyl-phosphate glycosyltransferase
MSWSIWRNKTSWILYDWQKMRKIIILIPVFNDWDSLKQLIAEINENISSFKDMHFECLIVNDASTVHKPKLIKPSHIKFLEILNMKDNKGHARCNAFGIRYIFLNKKFDNIILMDGDGEDRPIEIKSLLNAIIDKPAVSVVAKRVQRSEGLFFQSLYQIHKLITFIFTGKNINFGNYSILTKEDVEKLYSKASLWSSFSGTVKKYLLQLNEINSVRGLRYYGPSQMSLFKLLIHSFSIIAVFKYQVFIRSTFMIILLAYFNSYLGNLSIFLQILLVLFNLTIYAVSRREKEKDLIKSQENLKDIENIAH